MAQIEIAPMDPNEIIKAAPELLKHGAELVGALKLTEIAKTILGPATGEFAERVKDEIRLYRFGRQLELLKKAEKMVQDAGFTPRAVPIKLLFPLLEGASMEEDENLHTMWAALLANAALPENADEIRPGFIAILKQMAPDEAILLNALHGDFTSFDDEHGHWEPVEMLFHKERLLTTFESLGMTETGGLLCLERLQAQHLIFVSQKGLDGDTVTVTISAVKFLAACRPPQPKS